MANRLFGHMPDGTPIQEYTLENQKITAKILTYGGILQSLFVDGKDIVCGYDTLEDYFEDDSYQGALIGRVGNRIGGGRFEMNGKEYILAKNDKGRHHLHGGDVGFNSRVWTVEEADDTHITLSLLSPDGEEGSPGNLFVKVTYTLTEDAIMLAYNAICDADTPINLTNHAYFNLGGVGSGNILDFTAQISADTVTAVDEELIPTGEHICVADTPFDFREAKAIGASLDESFAGYDHNYIFANAPTEEVAGIELPHVATFSGKGLTMKVYTDRPCAQFYTGNFLGGAPDFKGGVTREKRGAFCFETQSEPDGVNHGALPLPANELFHTVTVYRFSD